MSLWWVEAEDQHGLPSWLRFVECGHWGLILTRELPRWHMPRTVGFGGVLKADAAS